jgi:DNA polymerase II large subunit
MPGSIIIIIIITLTVRDDADAVMTRYAQLLVTVA